MPRQPAAAAAVPSSPSPRLREGLLIAVAAACAYLLLSLASYSPADPGWSATGDGSGVRNLGGPAGAWLADVCFSLIGYLAYLFPVLLAYRAALLFTEREQPWVFSGEQLAVRALGLLLVMASGTAIAALNLGAAPGLPQGAGGILGLALADAMLQAFSAVGSRLLLVAVFLFGMTIFTDLSWLRLMDRLGGLAIDGGWRLRRQLAARSTRSGEATRSTQASNRPARGAREKAQTSQDQTTQGATGEI